MTVGQRIKQKLKEQHISQNKLARAAQISQSGVSDIINGISSPKEVTLVAIAEALNCTVAELLGEAPPGIVAIMKNAVPIVGDIACGTPITAQQNIEGYADLPSGVRADFALKCKGDSMSPTFEDGDLVLIRQQPDVEDGQIAAVNVACEATLKHVYHHQNGLLLVADNPKYAPMFVREDIIIHGLAVGYIRMFRR
jgi:repressor LexA